MTLIERTPPPVVYVLCTCFSLLRPRRWRVSRPSGSPGQRQSTRIGSRVRVNPSLSFCFAQAETMEGVEAFLNAWRPTPYRAVVKPVEVIIISIIIVEILLVVVVKTSMPEPQPPAPTQNTTYPLRDKNEAENKPSTRGGPRHTAPWSACRGN